MAPSQPFLVSAAVAASPLTPRYAQAVDQRAAYELLAARLEAAPALERSFDVPAYDEAPAGSRRARTDVRFDGARRASGPEVRGTAPAHDAPENTSTTTAR